MRFLRKGFSSNDDVSAMSSPPPPPNPPWDGFMGFLMDAFYVNPETGSKKPGGCGLCLRAELLKPTLLGCKGEDAGQKRPRSGLDLVTARGSCILGCGADSS